MAQNDLSQLKAFTPDLEVRHFNRPGMWRITSTFGRDEIQIEPELVAERRPPKKKMITRGSRIKLVPAFHTYDSDYNWLGITLCLSGKWGPPYQFIQIEQEKIYDFDWGCWNFGSPSDEPPQDYVKRMIGNGNDGNFYLISEVPAAHQYAGEEYMVHSEPYNCYEFVGEWVSDPYSQTVIWEAPNAGTLCLRKLQWHSLVNFEYTVRLSDGSAVGPSSTSFAKDDIFETAILEAYGGEQSKSISRAERFVREYFGSDWEERTQVCLTPCISYEFDQWATQVWSATSGAYLWSPPYHSTFDGKATTDGCIVYAFDNFTTSNYYSYQNSYPNYASFPYDPETNWLVNPNPSISEWSSDYIMVFGRNYHLSSFGGSYYDSDGHVEWATPRIYRPSPDGPLEYCFCSMYKSPGYINLHSYEQMWWEYLAFTPEHEQYNDPEIRFQVVNPTAGWPFLHAIPDVKTPDGQQCYGNGEFSLIEMLYPESVSIEVEI